MSVLYIKITFKYIFVKFKRVCVDFFITPMANYLFVKQFYNRTFETSKYYHFDVKITFMHTR